MATQTTKLPPLTPNMRAVLKLVAAGKDPLGKPARTAQAGAKRGGLTYTLGRLAGRGLIASGCLVGGRPRYKLTAAGKAALAGRK